MGIDPHGGKLTFVEEEKETTVELDHQQGNGEGENVTDTRSGMSWDPRSILNYMAAILI